MSMNGGTKNDKDIVITPGADPSAQLSEMRASIEQTRAQMSGTIGALEDRLSPARVKEQILEQIHDAKERVKSEVQEEIAGVKLAIRKEIHDAKAAAREATIGKVENMVQDASETLNETGNTIMSTIRENPIPALLTGIGLTWLFFGARSAARQRRPRYMPYEPADEFYGYEDQRYGYAGREAYTRGTPRAGDTMRRAVRGVEERAANVAHRARDAAGNFVDEAGNILHSAEEAIGNAAEHAGDAVGELAAGARRVAHDASERVVHVSREARDEAIRLEQRVERTMQENPLAVGAAAFAIGTAVGLTLPRTRREDELLGGARDKLLQKAESFAEHAVDAAREKVEGAVETLGADKRASAPKNAQAHG